ncbi:sperm-associated antigen 8 [Thamnophis elegans]|uniref:sperm-associated antigen 8 n=1 Tax=Thamnophis elegans TaxID=35005 RepID=UPI00137719D1|nr:sperm-associated antigen 8 [Thamnophis elegans]
MEADSQEEPRGIPAETAPCPAERPPEPEADRRPQRRTRWLPPCHGVPGPYLGELPAADLEPPLPCVPEAPREPPARGQCLMHNWQEERATNDLDHVPRPEYGTEGFFYRHGHPGLLTLDFLAGTPHHHDEGLLSSTRENGAPCARETRGHDGASPVPETQVKTMSFSPPPARHLAPRHCCGPSRWFGEQVDPLVPEAASQVLEGCYRIHPGPLSTSLLAGDTHPPPEPMESLSITHRDYRQEGFHSAPLPPTQPHDYRLEQPQTFWLEHARQVPGTSSIRTGDTPFRKCATFTTPLPECLDQPSLYSPENCPNL